MKTIFIIGILIVLIILFLSILTINKGYSYKHTIDDPPKPDAEGSDPKGENEQPK